MGIVSSASAPAPNTVLPPPPRYLSLEVYQLVVAELEDDTSTLRSLALANKIIHSVVARTLYSSISVSCKESIGALTSALSQRPQLSGAVRRLKVQWRPACCPAEGINKHPHLTPNCPSCLSDFSCALYALLQHTPHLQHLHLSAKPLTCQHPVCLTLAFSSLQLTECAQNLVLSAVQKRNNRMPAKRVTLALPRISSLQLRSLAFGHDWHLLDHGALSWETWLAPLLELAGTGQQHVSVVLNEGSAQATALKNIFAAIAGHVECLRLDIAAVYSPRTNSARRMRVASGDSVAAERRWLRNVLARVPLGMLVLSPLGSAYDTPLQNVRIVLPPILSHLHLDRFSAELAAHVHQPHLSSKAQSVRPILEDPSKLPPCAGPPSFLGYEQASYLLGRFRTGIAALPAHMCIEVVLPHTAAELLTPTHRILLDALSGPSPFNACLQRKVSVLVRHDGSEQDARGFIHLVDRTMLLGAQGPGVRVRVVKVEQEWPGLGCA
jgi:hypothetical protein